MNFSMNEELVLKGEYQDFIGSYSGVVDSEYCNELIKEFDYFHDLGSTFCGDRQFEESLAGRFDYAIDLHHMGNIHMGTHYSHRLNEVLWECFSEYQHVFGSLKPMHFYSTAQKMQMTPAGGGYHIWHCEDSTSNADSNRAAVWMLYLNDDYDGGETEFLYYKRRVNPERGKLLIWPAGYTHTHRGGLVLKGNKYVVTGWINYARE